MNSGVNRRPFLHQLQKHVLRSWQLYILLLPAVIFVGIFHYVPMYGIQIAFKDFKFTKGIEGSTWIGIQHFERFLTSPNFKTLLTNTLNISLSNLLWAFTPPIILAIMLNELNNPKFKKTVQMITYLPHFLSAVAVCGMITLFTDKDHGIINLLIDAVGGERIGFLTRKEWFVPIMVISGIWEELGWSSIIYVASLSGVDVAVVEASRIDGANRLQKIWYIDIPHLMPTIIILLILRTGSLLSVGYTKVLLLQNSMNLQVSDIISTYVYRMGIGKGQFSYTTAVGLFNSMVNIVILTLVNMFAKKVSDTSLW